MSESHTPAGDSEQRMEELDAETGSSASADEFKQRIDTGSADTEHGTSEGQPNPVTAESSPEAAGTHKEDTQDVNTQDPVTAPYDK